MKIVVYPHDLGIGGSQLIAIELAAAVRELGHEVIVFGRRGALVERIKALGLEFVEAPAPGRRPSPTTARALQELAQQRSIDIVHGYEWPPTLDALLAFPAGRGPRVVSTVMSMSVPPFVPHSVPLIVGTEQIAAAERDRGRTRVRVIEPPVDLAHNVPGSIDEESFRRTHGLDPRALTVVAVARLAHELKLEGTLTAITVVGNLARTIPVQLVLVGDGPARAEVERAAASANAVAGRRAVILTGELSDPRPAYAAADIALGMGGSALRSLAFGKPLVVQGESGFWRRLEPSSLEDFLWAGWYGVGAGSATGAAALEREITPLVRDAALRAELGAYGSAIVQERFSLTRAGRVQADIYAEAAAGRLPRALASETIAYARYARYYGAKRIRRALGIEETDDFNARPVAGTGRQR